MSKRKIQHAGLAQGPGLTGLALGAAASLAGGLPALAAQPEPGAIGLQAAATPVMVDIVWFHDVVLTPLITAISLFVLGLLIYVVVKFNKKANPVPSKTTHHPLLEIIWTGVPVLILVLMAIPSFRLLYKADVIPPDVTKTVKIVSHQWYWSYEYPEDGGIKFESRMVNKDDFGPGKPLRLLEVDNRMVVPVQTKIRILVTSADVIHNFAVPAFGLKIDTYPGRVNQAWFEVLKDKEGVYYGQCSELCGEAHGFMPIAIEVVSKEKFAAWVAQNKGRTSGIIPPDQIQPTAVAQSGGEAKPAQ